MIVPKLTVSLIADRIWSSEGSLTKPQLIDRLRNWTKEGLLYVADTGKGWAQQLLPLQHNQGNFEVNGSESGALGRLRSTSSAYDAGLAFERYYERPAVINPARGDAAQRFYQGGN